MFSVVGQLCKDKLNMFCVGFPFPWTRKNTANYPSFKRIDFRKRVKVRCAQNCREEKGTPGGHPSLKTVIRLYPSAHAHPPLGGGKKLLFRWGLSRSRRLSMEAAETEAPGEKKLKINTAPAFQGGTARAPRGCLGNFTRRNYISGDGFRL